MKYPVDTLSFCYPESGHCKIYIKIENDSIPVVFDTGATHSLFSNTQLFEKAKGKTQMYNIWGDKHIADNLYLDTIFIGNTKYYQKYPYNGIKGAINTLGCDIMKNFAWKIDFIRQKIYFSKSVFPLLSASESHKLPFVIKYNLCWATCLLNGEKQEFILDTGNPIFAHVNNHNKDADTINSKNFIYWDKINEPISNPLLNKSNRNIYTETYSIGNIEFDSLTLKDEIILHNVFDKSSLGLDFFERFEYVIFDYPNETIYFGPYRGKTSAYVFNTLIYINSMMPISVSGIIKGIDSSMKRRGIALGDTIIRINDYTIDEYKALTQKITEGGGKLADSISITIKRDSAKFILSRKHLVDMPDSVFSYGYKDALAMGICKSHHIYRDSVSNSFYVKYIMDYKLKECSSN